MIIKTRMTSTNLSPKQLNFAHLVLACVDVIKQLLIDILDIYIKPSNLCKKVKQCNDLMSGRHKLNSEQLKKCGFTSPHIPDYSQFDVTLLYTLIRNLCPRALTPTNGWGKKPQVTDTQLGDDIERIRQIRNTNVAHVNSGELDDTEFEGIWSDLEDVVKRIQSFTTAKGCSSDFLQQLADLKGRTVEIDEYTSVIKSLEEEIKEKVKTTVPWNVKEIYKKVVSEWKEKDYVYFETHSFPAMFDQIKNQPYVTFVGSPGSGKSATAHHIALKLQNEEGYDILPVKEVSKIEDYCDPERPQVFVIDDVVGVFGLNNGQFEMLERYRDRIISAEMSKIIMTCREVVFRNETVSKCFLTEKANVIKLQSEDNKLSDEDKLSLLASYGLDASLIPLKRMSETSSMFPFLCKMFSEQKTLSVHGYWFFITPITYIKDALDEMQTRNKIHYVSLVLLMLHQNKLSETELVKELIDNKPIDIKDVFRKCKVSSHTDSFEIADAIKEMDGTYTQTCDDQFFFIHDSMFEIVACQFGRQFSELILKYMSSEYIAYYIKVGTNGGEINENESEEMLENIEHLSITLHESQLPMFAERLFIDLKDGEIIGIFKSLKHPSIMQAFQTLIKEKQYDELYTAFLSNKVSCSLIEITVSETYDDYIKVLALLYLLTGRFINKFEHSNFVRAIGCFVLRGQHGILQDIIDQIMTQKGNINDLFQPFCNKEQQSGQGVNEDDTGAEVERTENDDTTVETTAIKIENQTKITLRYKNPVTNEEIVIDDFTRTGYKESESDNKSDIDICSEKMIVEQWRLLCLGCHSGDVNTVKILLKYISKDALNMHIKDYASTFPNETPLTVACTYGYFNIAKELIRAGANVNPNIDDRCALLHLSKCCFLGHWDIAKELIKAGADDNRGNVFVTPLKAACEQNNLSAVRLLIKAGANLNLKAENKTPLQVSYDAKNLRIADELIKAGANSRTSCDDKSENFEMQNNAGIDINPNQKKTSTKYKTPLIIACVNKDDHIVRLLIKSGADIHKCEGHRTPLDVACQKRRLTIIKILIKAGADVNPINAKMSPLMVACYYSDVQCVQDWIKRGALLNLKTEKGTPLIIACKQCDISVFEELIKRGADVNLEANGEIPLTAAACSQERFFNPIQNPHIYKIKSLIKAGADVNLEAGEQTPLTAVLHFSEEWDRTYFMDYVEYKIHVVKILLQAGADFNQKAGDETPLLVACRNGYTDVVDEFIKTEADFKLASQDETHMTDVCKETNINVKEWLDKMETDFILGLQYKSQLLTACLLKQLTIADLFKADGDCITCQDDNNKTHRSKCLIEELGEDKSLIKKSGVNANPKNVMSFLMKTACQIGQFNLVKELVEFGVDINLIDGNETPLIISCQRGHVTVIKELIKAGVDVNTGAGCNYPLLVACEKMHIDAVKELIQAGAVVNLESSKKTPLTTVCELYNSREVFAGRVDIILQKSILEALIKAGSDVDMKAGDETPLIIVCKKGNIEVVKLLLESGADVNLAAGGVTPLTAACNNYHLNDMCKLDVVEEFIKAGADVNLKDKDHTPLTLACQEGNLRIIAALINAGADVNLKAWRKRPLTVACTEGHFDVVKYLIQKGACVNLDDGIKPPLEIAYDRKFMRIVEYLVNAGASINFLKDVFAPITIACQMGRINDVKKIIKAGSELNPSNVDKTPLTAACQKGHLSLVKELIYAGASVDLMDRFSTPLTTACLWGHLSVVRELINAGASVDMVDKFNTPLTTACLWGHLDIVKELIRAGSNVNLRDVSNTPLTNACYWRELEIVKELIKSGADVNLQDEENTPLTIACLNNRIEIVKELIEAKANVNVEAGGNTPLTAACEGGDRCIVEMLIKAGADVNLGIEFETTDTDEGTDDSSLED